MKITESYLIKYGWRKDKAKELIEELERRKAALKTPKNKGEKI